MQRISTILSFVGELKDEEDNYIDKLHLLPAKYIKSLDNVSWDDLDKSIQIDFKREKIDFKIIKKESTADTKLRAYVAQGEILPVATRSFGSIGVFAIPEMGRFYRHVLIEKNFPHHGAVAFGHFGKTLYEVFKYIGVDVDEIGFNQPKNMLYKTENPFS